MTIHEKLIELNACEDAREWAQGKTMQEIWDTCPRGDWMLWLWKRIYPDDLQTLTLAKGHCAATVLHLMKDERSRKAIQAAIDFGEGKISYYELRAAAYASAADAAAAAYAYYASAAAAADAATAAYYASTAAAYAAYASAADAAAAAYAYYASAAAAADAATAAYYATAAQNATMREKAREENQMLTANICRKYLKCPEIR